MVVRRVNFGLVILGLALLSLTPAAPEFIRRPELFAVHAFRPLDALRDRLVRSGDDEPIESMPPEIAERIERGLASWDEQLAGEAAGPDRVSRIARLVRIDRGRRRLLIDAGAGTPIAAGDPVTAGNYAIGVVSGVVGGDGGLAVVNTPWTPHETFAAACTDAIGNRVRLILTGLDRTAWTASVSHPERESALRAGENVIVPEVSDLIPDSVPRLPAGLLVGVLVQDELQRRAGTEAYRAAPRLDVRGLDAVSVRVSAARSSSGSREAFERRPVGVLGCGLASPGRDGLLLTGIGLPKGGAVTVNGLFVGVIDGALGGAARVRGVFDPGREQVVLVLSNQGAGPLGVRAVRSWLGGGRLEVPNEQSLPQVGDLLVTSGRGDHVPRGLFIGSVVQVARDDRTVDVLRGAWPSVARVEVLRRSSFPSDLWGDG